MTFLTGEAGSLLMMNHNLCWNRPWLHSGMQFARKSKHAMEVKLGDWQTAQEVIQTVRK